jgi:crossover junction endodeoxyribonuclease RuvC
MQLMVRALLSMSETPEPADAADALAVALCHVQAEKFRARLHAPAVRSAQEPPCASATRIGRRRGAASRIV